MPFKPCVFALSLSVSRLQMESLQAERSRSLGVLRKLQGKVGSLTQDKTALKVEVREGERGMMMMYWWPGGEATVGYPDPREKERES